LKKSHREFCEKCMNRDSVESRRCRALTVP